MKTPLEVFDDYYAPDDAWAQRCRVDLATALAPRQESGPHNADVAKAKAARLIAAAPRMLEALKEAHQELRLLNAKEDGQQKYNTPASLVIESLGALLRDLHGDPS